MTFVLFSPEETLEFQSGKAIAFLDRAMNAARRLKLSAKREERLFALLGVGGCMRTIRLSDVTARLFAAELLYQTIERELPAIVPTGMSMFHITFVDDIGLTSDRTPSLRLVAMKRKVDKAMRALGVSGVVMLEVQPLLNYPAKGRGRTLMLNAHALAWGTVSRRRFRVARRKLNGSRSWQNHFGATPVVSRRLKRGLGDALRTACYLAKLPLDGKYRVPVDGGASYRFRSTTDYPDILALRIAEGLSHYSIYDAVFGVGSGASIRKCWKRELEIWHHERLATAEQVHDFSVRKFWRRVHATNANPLYLPFEIN